MSRFEHSTNVTWDMRIDSSPWREYQSSDVWQAVQKQASKIALAFAFWPFCIELRWPHRWYWRTKSKYLISKHGKKKAKRSFVVSWLPKAP